MDNNPVKSSSNTDIDTITHTPTSQNKSKPDTNQKTTELTPFHIIVLLSIFAAVILLIFTLTQIFRQNPYGEQIKINNLEKYYKEFSIDTKDSIFNTLYNIVSNNNPNTKLPKSGAKVRDGSTTGYYNKNTNIYTDNFIVDIEELKQSYAFQVTWSPNPNNPNLADVSYPVLATCPKKEQIIYESFNCVDSFTSNGIYNDPIFSILPISVSYYNKNYSEYTSYNITAKSTEDKVTIIINDETGGNHEAALKKLKEKGISPDNYTIVYNDLSAEQIPSRAPNDIKF